MVDVENKRSCSSSKENILYDLSVLAEWKSENEIFTKSPKEKVNASLIGRASSLARRSTWTFLRSMGIPMQMSTPCLLPEQLVRLKAVEATWRIAVSGSGNLIAIAQDSFIEIRSQADGMENFWSRAPLAPSPHPSWRCVAWAPDEVMVACSRSGGAVDVFDLMGSLLFTIPGTSGDMITTDLSDSVAALVFTDHKPKDEKWSHELLISTHHGFTSSYLMHRDHGFTLRFTHVFSEYPRGISGLVYCDKHKILFVGGSGLIDEGIGGSPRARTEGITAWRMMSGAPWLKLITDYEEDKMKNKASSFPSLRRMTSMFQLQRGSAQVDGIYKICLSPAQDSLAVVHLSGKLSLWEVPSLRLRREFTLDRQPDWEEVSPELLAHPSKARRLKDLVPHRQLVDVNWWSDTLLILARCTGAVSVASPENLRNLLGKSPEWFEPQPQVSKASGGGFLGLECEVRFPKKRIAMLNDEEEEEDSEDEDMSVMARGGRVTQQVLYYLTDSERFQPPKKKPKHVTKVHRIVQLRSTTPEELYARKIEAEEYGEALALAQAYSLDCDLVYQRQWRKADVDKASIQDYLAKISKRSWVLHECLERVPEHNIDAMTQLLEYGLRGTDLQALIDVGAGEDGGRFILCDPEEGLYKEAEEGEEEEVYDQFNPASVQRQKDKITKYRQTLWEQVNFDNLNLEQKELCRARLKFLQYLDRLKTYEMILGGPVPAAERYNGGFYASFRSCSIVEIVTGYARDNDWRAVETLMMFHSDELAPHRLAILSNFPETADPSEYKCLLPEMKDDNGVVPLETDQWREEDFAEDQAVRSAVSLGSEDEAALLYETFNNKYRTVDLTGPLVQQWYTERALEVEQRARLVDLSIELVKLGMERDVEGLDSLLLELVSMEMLVYECGVGPELTFVHLRDMADYDRLELMMSQSTPEMYAKNLHRWMVPYLQRCDTRETGAYDRLLRDFVLTRARGDLQGVIQVFEASKSETSGSVIRTPVIRTTSELMALALDTLYSCERDDQLHLATRVFDCLPPMLRDASKETPEAQRLYRQVDQLDHHISAARIFKANDMKMTLAYIRSAENDPEESRSLMVKLTRMAGKRAIPLSDLEWQNLHKQVMTLQTEVFRCISHSVCHEVFVESLMCSGRQDSIRLAGTMLERSCTETKPSRSQRGASQEKVTYSRAVELTLSAAREYFDSSANLSDPCMDLARSCLNLILDAPLPVQQELDLIASLALMEEFGVAILPLQVRLSTNRSELVQKAVTSRGNNYKQTQRLLRLGTLLGLSQGGTEVGKGDHKGQDIGDKVAATSEGLIITMCAEAAVAALDYEFANGCCSRLITLCYSPAWSVCVQLAQQEGFRDISAKARLLSFALTYCDQEMIQPVLQARCLLETQTLYEHVNTAVNAAEPEDSRDSRESPFSARAAIKQTQEILSSTKKTTSAVLSTMTDARWWQSAINSLKQPSGKPALDDVSTDDGNAGFKKQACHPFYASIIEECYEDVQTADYSGTHTHHGCQQGLSASILRTAKLEEMLTNGSTQQTAAEALVDLARQTMPRDAGLGIAYLLAAPRDAPVDGCFDALPSTDISLQLAVYYYALRVYSALKPFSPSHVYALYRQTPAKIIGRVLDFVDCSSEADWPEEVTQLVAKLQNYQGMLEDYNQAVTLQTLGKGVDVIRFAEDPQYKQETIFGLAMSVEDEVYDIALSLAVRYHLPVWDVYMCHLEYLFADSGMPSDQLQQRVTRLDIMTTLKGQQAEFTQRMMTAVYPTLAADDLRCLTYFFSLLDGVPEPLLCGLTASEHLALLKKLKSAAPTIDYKRLMDASTPPVDVLQPCLTAGNVNNLAKLASLVPDKAGGTLHPSSFYSQWATHVFWKGDGVKPAPDSMSGWVHRYEAIGEWVQKLRPEGLMSLLDSLVFTTKARSTLDVATRDEITKRALKFSKQSSKKKKQDPNLGPLTWEACNEQLQSRLNHLKSLTNDTIQSFAQSTDDVFSSYAGQYDLSKGDLDTVEMLLVSMILDGQAVELVDDVLQVAPPSSLTTRTVVCTAVGHVARALRGQDVLEVTVRSSWLEVLAQVSENVRDHQECGGALVTAEDVMALLREFCSDASIAVTPRLDVLKVLEKSFDLSEADTVLLTLYRTDALVASTWTDVEMSESRIISESARLHLFSCLLDKCTTRDTFVTLARILILWPKFSKDPSPWMALLQTMIDRLGSSSGDVINHIVASECTAFPLDEDDTSLIVSSLHHQPVSAICLALRGPGGPEGALTEGALGALAGLTQGVEAPQLLSLLLQHSLAPRVVSLPVYGPLVAHLLQGGDASQELTHDLPEGVTPKSVAQQLMQAGHEAEAGSLLLRSRSSHSSLMTFTSALASAAKWINKS